jgi:polyphenol oxidase
VTPAPTALRLKTVEPLAPIPGLVHGFELRWREVETREETRRRAQQALAPHGQLFFLKQVHGTRILTAPWEGTPEADAGLAQRGGVIVAIETADCMPVLLVEPVRRLVAAVHAGWRGTAAGIVRQAVAAIAAEGGTPGQVVAALGPAIGVCCYEVGPELRSSFAALGERVLRSGPSGKLHLDLREANRAQLEDAGVATIVSVGDCTCCQARSYYSYRRDGAGTGRMISFVGYSAEE